MRLRLSNDRDRVIRRAIPAGTEMSPHGGISRKVPKGGAPKGVESPEEEDARTDDARPTVAGEIRRSGLWRFTGDAHPLANRAADSSDFAQRGCSLRSCGAGSCARPHRWPMIFHGNHTHSLPCFPGGLVATFRMRRGTNHECAFSSRVRGRAAAVRSPRETTGGGKTRRASLAASGIVPRARPGPFHRA